MSTRRVFTIRHPGIDDVDGAAEVQNRGWREAYGHLLPEEFYDHGALDRRRTVWRRLVERPERSGRLFVAESGGEIVGVALAGASLDEHPVRELQLYSLYVISPYYGSGVGQALLDTVIGGEAAQLWVARDNPRAHAFYRRNGFTPDGAQKVDADLNDLVEVRLVR